MVNLSKFLSIFTAIFILTLLCSQIVFASPYDERHIKLLAVQTVEDGSTQGKSADLFLQLQDGSGRVFLDTTPLTKIDTQATTRYAKDVACDYFSLDCSKYDFFFTIRSDTSIVGGPSAGAATAALTAIAVMDLEHDEDVAVTGSINSGGTIGPVGGVKSKIEVAAQQDLAKVLVPQGALSEPVNYDSTRLVDWKRHYSDYFPQQTSSPFLLLDEYAELVLAISAIEVIDLSELLFELTGKNYTLDLGELDVDESYIEIMKELDLELCERSEVLIQTLSSLRHLDNDTHLRIETFQNNSLNARDLENYYASASACFGGNVHLQYRLYEEMNLSSEQFSFVIESLMQNVSLMQEQVESMDLLTISDLQTKMVVKERLREAANYFEIALAENSSYALAYGHERIISADTWSSFFAMEGKKLDLSVDSLQQACYAKILEAQERYRYATLFFSGLDLQYVFEKITTAQTAWETGDYELCLVQAAQAKAESSSIVSSIGLGTRVPADYIEAKKEAALRTLLKNTKEGQFPILGYSYYLFAENLEEDNSYTSLLYYEYALEMSELNIYFPEITEGFVDSLFGRIGLKNGHRLFFSGLFQGFLLGALLMWLYFHWKDRVFVYSKK